MKMVYYTPYGETHHYDHVVNSNKITHLSKRIIDEQDITAIHLDNGEVILSTDSIKTLSARMESD